MYKRKLRIIALIALIVCLGVGVYIWKSVDLYQFPDSGFYPLNGQKYDIAAGTEAKLDEETSVALITLAGEEISCSELCVYMDNSDAVVLTRTMGFFPQPEGDALEYYKLPCFSTIRNDGSNIVITRNNVEQIASGLFLFNGNNTYITLQPTVLTMGTTKVELSALSYVIACCDQWVQYYDYASDTYQIVYLENGTRVDMVYNEDFIIHADLDRVDYYGQENILVSAVDFFSEYK